MSADLRGVAPAQAGSRRPPILCVVGKKHVGKTTTVVRLSAALTQRGHRVMILKHGSHTFSLDPAGTDTYRHYHEGNAARVAMASPDKFALVSRWEEELAPEVIVERYLADADLVLAEGFKQSTLPKLEVARRAVFPTSLWEDGTIAADTCLAMVTDAMIPGFTGETFSLEDAAWVERCADWIERTFLGSEGR
ncbi:MAG: molybdopterin-guanine dinucleotide biosynthesis protein [Gemmatimonadota bacterium]|jgi:molybdopterin-guanine dinucleotide biosynthesis protein MobB